MTFPSSLEKVPIQRNVDSRANQGSFSLYHRRCFSTPSAADVLMIMPFPVVVVVVFVINERHLVENVREREKCFIDVVVGVFIENDRISTFFVVVGV